MRPERLRSIIKTALDEGGIAYSIEIQPDKEIIVALHAPPDLKHENLVEWKR